MCSHALPGLPYSPTLMLSGLTLFQWPTLSTVHSIKMTPKDVNNTIQKQKMQGAPKTQRVKEEKPTTDHIQALSSPTLPSSPVLWSEMAVTPWRRSHRDMTGRALAFISGCFPHPGECLLTPTGGSDFWVIIVVMDAGIL